MEVRKVKGVCSMITVLDNPSFTTKKKFIRDVQKAISEHNTNRALLDLYGPIDRSSVKVVQLVTNLGFFSRPLWLKKGYSYDGNSTRTAKVCYVTFKKGFHRYI